MRALPRVDGRLKKRRWNPRLVGHDMGVLRRDWAIDRAMKMLLAQWQEARSLWDDAMSERFERDMWSRCKMDLKRGGGGHGPHCQGADGCLSRLR